jgi:hypothetical protein
MDSWGTHLPVLMTFMARTRGPVLELGCGESSTPMLHAWCNERQIVSVESNVSFLGKFTHLTRRLHRFVHVLDWHAFDVRSLGPVWEIAFIDHAPAEQRVTDMDRLRDRAKFIILHDAQDPFYQPILASFRFRLDYSDMFPHTTVVSDIVSPNSVWKDDQ